MKYFLRIILLCCLFIHPADIFADQWLKGDTYTMKIFDGWVPSTTEKIEGQIGRRKIGRYNVTYTSRINIKESCSVEVLEYLNCKNGISVLQRDSLIYKESKKYRTIVWKKDNFSLRNVELHCIPERHPETGELESLKQKKWYIQGKKSLYVVIFSANDDKSYGKWVSKVESLTKTLSAHS